MIDFDTLALAPCMQAFGRPVIYVPGAGPAVSTTLFGEPLLGIFNRYSSEDQIDASTGATVKQRIVTLGMNESDFPPGMEPCQGHRFDVAGMSWVIADPPTPDGFGHVLYRLMRAAL